MKKLMVIISGGLLAALSVIAFLCTHGIQENGWLSVVLNASERPAAQDLVGQTVAIDSSSHAQITAISHDLNADGSVRRYRVHANLHCRSKQSLSLRTGSWNHVFLVSASQTESSLRQAAGLSPASDASLQSNALLR